MKLCQLKPQEKFCNWHTKIDSSCLMWMVFFSYTFIERTAIVTVSLCVYIDLKCTNSIFKSVQRPKPNDRFYCWLNVTAKRQPNINQFKCVNIERWLASCHQFNSGSKIVLFMCLFPYRFGCGNWNSIWIEWNGMELRCIK